MWSGNPEQIEDQVLPPIVPLAQHLHDPLDHCRSHNDVPFHLDLQQLVNEVQVQLGGHPLDLPGPRRRTVLAQAPLPVLQWAP